MNAAIDTADVPPVSLHDLYMPMKRLIASERGLALLNGLDESSIRGLEDEIWAHFADRPHVRVAVALRFRALLDVFGGRRLKSLFLQQGFKLIAKAIHEASTQRLNSRFGFKSQAFISALAQSTARRLPAPAHTFELLAA
jgi:hypothetical protein